MEILERAITLHKEKGRCLADLCWLDCEDINGISSSHKELREYIGSLTKCINTTLLNLDLASTDELFSQYKQQCIEALLTAKEQREKEIEIKNRPTNTFFDEKGKITYGPIKYNEKAIINLTQCTIPEDIKIILSYGPKFIFPHNTTNEYLFRDIAQLDNCIEDTINPILRQVTSQEIANVIKKRELKQRDPTKQWLMFVNKRTQNFFKMNKEIFATKSDKGGHVVVIHNDTYKQAMIDLTSGNEYEILTMDPLIFLKQSEDKLISICKKNYKCKNVTSFIRGYQNNCLQLPRFYGLPKVHKPGNKFRPIMSMVNSPGHALGKIFDYMLKEIFPITSHHFINSYEAKNFFDTIKFPTHFVLKSYDVVSMFTNIPTTLAKEIILEKENLFFEKFGIGKRILIGMLNFLLDECAVFTVNDKIYKQKKGLPMGSCISPTIARLTMDRVINRLLEKVPSIAFIKVYVDDTVAAVDPSTADLILDTLNSFHPDIKFTVESEDEKQSINFLNLTLFRNESKVLTKWYRKVFASGRLVPYFSSHKRTTIIGTAEAFIKTVLALSDPIFFQSNKFEVINTLRENAFPESLIEILMNKHYTLMKPINTKANERVINTSFKIFPHTVNGARKIKKILLQNMEKHITLADSAKNSKHNSVTTKKVPIHWRLKTNMILIARCQCKQKYKIKATAFNQTVEMLRRTMITVQRNCMNNLHAFRKVTHMNGLAYRRQTSFLLRYVKFFFSKNLLDDTTNLPNFFLSKAMKGAKLPSKILKGLD